MAENGKKPAMSIWGTVVRYHGRGGTSRGNLVVLGSVEQEGFSVKKSEEYKLSYKAHYYIEIWWQCSAAILPAGRIKLLLWVLGDDSPKNCQGEGDQCPDENDDNNRPKRKGGSRAVEDRHSIEVREGCEDRSTEERSDKQHIVDPIGAPQLLVIDAADVSWQDKMWGAEKFGKNKETHNWLNVVDIFKAFP